jgi:hypothetical protein
MFNNIGELCPKFKDLANEAKFIWLFTNEDISVLKLLGKYITVVISSVYMYSVYHYFISDSVRHKMLYINNIFSQKFKY